MTRLALTIATYDTPTDLLQRALHSATTQTYGDYDVFVLRDGESDEVPAWLASQPVQIHSFEENRGRYAVEHEFLPRLAAMGYELWAPLDSDDMAHPEWLEDLVRLIDVEDADVAFSAQVVRKLRGGDMVEGVRPWDGGSRLHWHAHLSGVWRLEFIQRWALTNPKFRVGWDSLMTAVPWVVGHVAYTQRPLVLREQREGSLTTSRETGFGSSVRRSAQARVSGMFTQIARDPFRTKEVLTSAR